MSTKAVFDPHWSRSWLRSGLDSDDPPRYLGIQPLVIFAISKFDYIVLPCGTNCLGHRQARRLQHWCPFTWTAAPLPEQLSIFGIALREGGQCESTDHTWNALEWEWVGEGEGRRRPHGSARGPVVPHVTPTTRMEVRVSVVLGTDASASTSLMPRSSAPLRVRLGKCRQHSGMWLRSPTSNNSCSARSKNCHFVCIDKSDSMMMIGSASANSITANRFSFLMYLKGAYMPIDTACFCFLVALHVAQQ